MGGTVFPHCNTRCPLKTASLLLSRYWETTESGRKNNGKEIANYRQSNLKELEDGISTEKLSDVNNPVTIHTGLVLDVFGILVASPVSGILTTVCRRASKTPFIFLPRFAGFTTELRKFLSGVNHRAQDSIKTYRRFDAEPLFFLCADGQVNS